MYPTDCILWVPFAILVICIAINKYTYVYIYIVPIQEKAQNKYGKRSVYVA